MEEGAGRSEPTEGCRFAGEEGGVKRGKILQKGGLTDGGREETGGGDVSVWGDQRFGGEPWVGAWGAGERVVLMIIVIGSGSLSFRSGPY